MAFNSFLNSFTRMPLPIYGTSIYFSNLLCVSPEEFSMASWLGQLLLPHAPFHPCCGSMQIATLWALFCSARPKGLYLLQKKVQRIILPHQRLCTMSNLQFHLQLLKFLQSCILLNVALHSCPEPLKERVENI
jgi:hypothetical protein